MKYRILLVEDDACVGAVMLEILLKVGYDVTLAEGLGAVKKLRHFDFAAVVTDFQLLDGDACDVIDFLRTQVPEIPAIVTSGGGRQVETDCDDRKITNVVFLNKPFRPQQLQDSLLSFGLPAAARLVKAQA